MTPKLHILEKSWQWFSECPFIFPPFLIILLLYDLQQPLIWNFSRQRGNKAPIIKINRHSAFSDGLSDSNED